MIDRLKSVLCSRKGKTAALEDTVIYDMPPSREEMTDAIGDIYNYLEDIIDRAYPVRADVEDDTPSPNVDTFMEQINEFIDLCNWQEAGK